MQLTITKTIQLKNIKVRKLPKKQSKISLIKTEITISYLNITQTFSLNLKLIIINNPKNNSSHHNRYPT